MKLNKGVIGRLYRVEEAALPQSMKRRLAVLGMTNGTDLEVMNNKSGGTRVVKIRGTRFALGRHITENVEVTAL